MNNSISLPAGAKLIICNRSVGCGLLASSALSPLRSSRLNLPLPCFAALSVLLVLLLGFPSEAGAKWLFGKDNNKNCRPVSICTEEKEQGRTFIKGRVLIKAPPKMVWDSVHEERKSDPDIAYSKVLERAENHVTLEQKFTLIPIIGSSVCVMSDSEVPLERIDYKLIKSDHFKSLEGSWVLTPCEGGQATYLELSSHIDFGMPVPKIILNSVASKKLERRLKNVQKMAEELNVQTANRLISENRNLKGSL